MNTKQKGVTAGLALGLTVAFAAVTWGCGAAAPAEPTTPVELGPPKAVEPKFVPPDNKILFIIGQDVESVREYTKALPDPQPGGVTMYTNMVVHELSPFPPLAGLTRGEDEDAMVTGTANSQSSQVMVRENPNSTLVIGLYLAHAEKHGCSTMYLDKINKGEYDEYIDEMANYLKSLNRPVYLRIGYEFDGYWNCYKPEPHKKAFIRMVKRLRELGADNVASVWQSATWPFDNTEWAQWYPGDEYVDWIGFSYFLADTGYLENLPPNPDLARESLLAFARSRNKPVMIAEASDQGYDNEDLTRSVINKNAIKPLTQEQIWDGWYQPFFDYIHANADVIKAVAYINSDWDSQPMWQCRPGIPGGQAGCTDGYWGDSRVHVNEHIKTKWVEELSKEVWLHGSPELFGILGLR